MTNRLKMFGWAGACALVLALTSAPARADVIISNGSLVITVHSSNGTFSAVFPNVPPGSSNFYDPGVPVSDFGLQTGTNTSTFRINSLFNALGSPGIPGTLTPMTGTATSATFNGTYTAGGANVALSRTYSIFPGANALVTTSTFTNNGGAAITLRFFENNDPDQDANAFGRFDTLNSVKTLTGGFRVAEDTGPVTGLTAVIGSTNPGDGTVVGFGGGSNPFGIQIFDGNVLNQLFATPFQPAPGTNDEDIGAAGAIQFTLNPGQSFTFTFDQGFGLNPAAAETAFLAAAAPPAVPEPTSVLLFGLAGVAALGYHRRRRAAA
jgi:hypothetical protein